MLKKIIKKVVSSVGYTITKGSNNSNPKSPAKKILNYKVVDPLVHNTSENMNGFFSDETNLEIYVSGRQAFYKKLANMILPKVSKLHNEYKMVDVGCGPGDLINILSEKVNKTQTANSFYGFDHSEKVIEIGNKRFPYIHFLQFNIFEDYKTYHSYFDTVICSEVIEHLLKSKEAVKNLISMVRSGGVLIVTVPEGRKDNYLGHINFWSPESWKVFIEEICEEGNLVAETGLLDLENRQYNYATIKRISRTE